MPKEPKYKLIEEETLRELLSTQFQLSYSIILLSYICQRNKLDTTLTANEAGGIIKLSPRQIRPQPLPDTGCKLRDMQAIQHLRPCHACCEPTPETDDFKFETRNHLFCSNTPGIQIIPSAFSF